VNTGIYHSGFQDRALVWTLIASMCLHILALVWVPKFKLEPAIDQSLILRVELMEPKVSETSQVSAPEPVSEPEPKPEEPKPQEKPKPEPIVKRVVKPVTRHDPAPITEPLPNEVNTTETDAEPSAEPASAPAVITAAPEVQTPSAFPAPAPEPLKPIGPSQQDINSARDLYGSQLAREIAKHKQYPRIAQMRGWQGEVIVDLQLDGNGRVLSSKIHTSSGFDVLDKQALEMVKKASPFPAPPSALRGNLFNILVPVSFRLEQ
jgi:protein TonB